MPTLELLTDTGVWQDRTSLGLASPPGAIRNLIVNLFVTSSPRQLNTAANLEPGPPKSASRDYD